MPDRAIEVERLVKTYGEVRAVDGIDLSVAAGEVFAFLGQNGAGKTTTVEILEGVRPRTSGAVRVLGLDPWQSSGELSRRVGFIPQDFTFFDKITPREGIEFYATLFARRVDPMGLLRQVELAEKADARFDELSGGQKRKLGLALALVNDPQVLFLDEPTTGLDPQARRALWEVIRSFHREGRTVFLTTHYLEEAQVLADRVAILRSGQLIAQGTPEEIIRAHARPDVLEFEGPAALAGPLGTAIGRPAEVIGDRVAIEVRDAQETARAVRVASESGIPWRRLEVRRDTLEDVFLRLVGTSPSEAEAAPP